VVFGDILRVLPHVVLGLVQGKRLRQQLAEEEEERQFARAQRAFELWRMQVAQQAFEQQQRMAQAVQQWLQSADLEPEPEPTEITPPPATPTAPTTTLPSLTTLPSPRERLAPQTPTTVPAPSPAEALKSQRSRRPLLPTPQLRLPSQTEVAPTPTAVPTTPTTPEVTGQPLIEVGLRDIGKALSAAPQATAISQLQPQMAPAVMAKLSNLVHAGVVKVMRGVAREMVRQGLVRNEWEAQEKADYWHQVLTVLTTSLPPNELLNPYIQRAQQQRDYWRQVEEKAREMRLRGVEAWGRLGEVFGRLGQQYLQRADRLRGWVFRLLSPITRLIEARMNVPREVLQSELNALRFWLSQGRNVYVNLTDPHDLQRVQGMIDQVFAEIQREGAARQQTLEALQKALEKIQADLSAKASLLEAIGERYEQAEIAIRLDAYRQLQKELGEPAPDISQVQRLYDFVLRGDIPEPPPSGIEEADVPATPTQPSPAPTTPPPGIPPEELSAQPPPMTPPTTTPSPQPTQPTQPTPPAPTATTEPTRPTPTTQAPAAAPHPFTALAMRGILSAAEQREINEALQNLRLANEQLRNELLRLERIYRPRLYQARERQINASIRRMQVSMEAQVQRLQQSGVRLAWQQASRIFGGFVNLVPRLQTKDGKPIPPEKAVHYSTRLWGAALKFASGDAARAHKELQNIANEWKRAGYKLPERQDLSSALLEALWEVLEKGGRALPSPSGAPPQTPTKTPSPKTAPQTPQAPQRPSAPPPTFDIDEDELEDLLGGSPF
jgi:tetratricopeptide (TPR) repeat protein